MCTKQLCTFLMLFRLEQSCSSHKVRAFWPLSHMTNTPRHASNLATWKFPLPEGKKAVRFRYSFRSSPQPTVWLIVTALKFNDSLRSYPLAVACSQCRFQLTAPPCLSKRELHYMQQAVFFSLSFPFSVDLAASSVFCGAEKANENMCWNDNFSSAKKWRLIRLTVLSRSVLCQQQLAPDCESC